ncbi:Regulating synaptic membrane exocytosis protein 3, partial [Armadillidium nasatum]
GTKKRSTSGFQRSHEVLPSSKDSTDDSLNSVSSESSSSRGLGRRHAPEGQISEFIEGLGPGQLVGRQVLAAPALGDIQLSMCERKNKLEVEVTVWGDYGRMEGRKVFMGVAQIMLDDLDLSNIVIGWYKLFGTSSLVSLPTLTRRGSMVSLDSFG